ncbi:hypothetical protein C1646_767660, partial [Rhizophagus diaphanus]
DISEKQTKQTKVSQSAQNDKSGFSQILADQDVFVLDTSSLYAEKLLPLATRERSLISIVKIHPVEIRDNLRSSASISLTRTRTST